MYMFLFFETSNNIIVLYIYMYNFCFETSKEKAWKAEREAAEKGESCGNIPYAE